VFEFFRGSNDFIVQKSLFIAVNASLCWLNNGQLLIFASPPNYKWSIVEQG
jgi:hypothetical protein